MIEAGKTYIVGVSGGVDSMVLLDLILQQGGKAIVAHVNYGVRESARRDTKLVETVCLEKNVPCYVRYAEKPTQGNFQKYARDVRYSFFCELAKNHHTDTILVAHHQDDLLETYLLQKNSQRSVDYYGLAEKIDFQGFLIERVLLEWNKNDLITYAKENSVLYFDDESNSDPKYARNKIRHETLANYSEEQKKALLLEIKEKNDLLNAYKSKYKNIELETLSMAMMQLLTKVEQRYVLMLFLKKHHCYDLKRQKIEDLQKLLYNSKNWVYSISEDVEIEHTYGLLQRKQVRNTFLYTIEKNDIQQVGNYEIRNQGDKREGLHVQEDEFPLIFRSAKIADEITLSFGTKKLSRWFIDQKIPKAERASWPVLCNKYGEIIFVVGIGANNTHFSYNPNMFVVKW